MIIPFLPLYLLDLGVSPVNVKMWSGVIFAASFLVAALMAPYWGRRADRAGKRRLVMRAGFSLAIVYFLGSLVRDPVELFFVRILQGFASGFVPASMAIVATSTPPEKLGFGMGIMQTGLVIGGIIGPLAGGVLSHVFGMRLSFVVAAIGIFMATIAVGIIVKEPQSTGSAVEGSLMDDLKTAFGNRILVRMLLLLFVVQIVSMTLQPLIALYVAELQGTLEGVVLSAGIVYSLAGIASAIAAPLWGRTGQAKGYYFILVIAFIGAGLFNMGQFFAVDIYQFGILQFLFGLFIVGVYPAINTIAVGCIEANFQGRVFGLTNAANQLGSMVGPLIGGFMSSWIGIQPMFLFTGSTLIILGAIVYFEFFRYQVTKV